MSLSLVVGLFAVWSSIFSLGKAALVFAPPVFVTGFRMILGAGVLLAFSWIKERKFVLPGLKDLLPIAILGVISIYLTNILEFWGLQHLTAGKACFIYSLSPFFAAILSYFHFRETMTWKKGLGLLIGFLGMIPVFVSGSGSEEIFTLSGLFSWPTFALMGAAFLSVYGWILLRVLVKTDEVSPTTANSYSMLFGGGLALIHSLFTDSWSPTPIETGFFLAFMKPLLLMTFVSAICYNLYGFLLKRYTATFLSFMGLLSPFFASIHGWIFLGEPISLTICISTLIVCVGLWLVYSSELKQGYVLKKAS